MELVIENSAESTTKSREENKRDLMKKQIDLLYEAAGSGSESTSLGCYQRFLAIVMILSIGSIGTIIYGLPFYEKIPDYQC